MAKKAKQEELVYDYKKEQFEDRDDLVAYMNSFKHNKCLVVLQDTVEWSEGVVTGILNDLRAKVPMWVVKTNEGRTARRAYASNLIKLSEEKVEVARKQGGFVKREVLTIEELFAQQLEAAELIGKFIMITDGRADAEEGAMLKVLVVNASIDQRASLVRVRVQREDGTFAYRVYDPEWEQTGDVDELTLQKGEAVVDKARMFIDNPNALEEIKQAEIDKIKSQIEALKLKLAQAENELENTPRTVEIEESEDEAYDDSDVEIDEDEDDNLVWEDEDELN